MTKVKLKFPSLRSTSRDIAEDLKAIREALNVKPAKAKETSKKTKRESSPVKASSRKVNGVVAPASPQKSRKNQSAADMERRSSRQRKPNQRYTDLISEVEKPHRKRDASAVSSVCSEDYVVESPKKRPPKKEKVAPAASSSNKKKKVTPVKKDKIPKKRKEKKPAPVTDTEDDEDILDDEPKEDRITEMMATTDDEDIDGDEDDRYVPPPRIREDDEEVNYKSSTVINIVYPDKPKRKYIKSGKYSKKNQAKASNLSSRSHTTGFEAPPEFDDDEALAKHSRSPMRSPLFGTGPTSSAMPSTGVYMDYDDRGQDSVSSPQQQHFMNDGLQYGTLSPSHVMNMQSSGSMQQSTAIGDYSGQAHIIEQHQNYGQNQYDDGYEDGPALVYGPGPRTITYNGEFYFLSPIPPKRRCSQGPRPRSSRYKPFSTNYKPPDVYKYRERLKQLRKKRQQMPKRRSTMDLYAGLTDDARIYPNQHGLYRRPMDETDHALEALKSTIGTDDDDEATLLAAAAASGNGFMNSDYFGSSPASLLGNGGGAGGSSGGFLGGDWDRPGSEFGERGFRGRGRGVGLRGAAPAGLVVSRKRKTVDDLTARGVYGDEEPDESYRFAYGASSVPKKRLKSDNDESFGGPNEVTGDHCYIKKPIGVGSFIDQDDTSLRLSNVTASVLDSQGDSYEFGAPSTFSLENQVIETTTVPFDNGGDPSDFDVAGMMGPGGRSGVPSVSLKMMGTVQASSHMLLANEKGTGSLFDEHGFSSGSLSDMRRPIV